MYMQVVSMAHSLEPPHAALGDATLSPMFHRVSARCPVLHLFGYVHIPSDLTLTTAGPSTLVMSTGSRHVSSSVPANKHHCDAEIAASVTPRSLSCGSSRGGPLRLSRATPLVSRLRDTSAPVQYEDASSLPKRVAHALDADGHCNEVAAAGAVAQHGDTSFSSFLPPRSTPRAAMSALGGEGDLIISPDGSLRSSAAWCGRYTQRRACLHVHGVYPSLLLPQYDRDVSADQLAAQLETVALRVLTRQGTFVPGQQLVHNVRLVHRFNVYGYRSHAYAFYEVELIDPDLLPRVVDVLQNSTEVGGRKWQLYDAHYSYHTQFMVRWRVNGVAPFLLPAGQCHVRLPTVAELTETLPFRSASLDAVSRLQEPQHSCSRDRDAAKQELKDNDKERHPQAAARSVQQSHRLLRRYWQPDELGRATTAEVELDVSGADLLNLSPPLGEEEEEEGNGTAVALRGRPKTMNAGDNLSYTRRIIQHYFREHGVLDALRVADTIAMECRQQECVRVSAAEVREQRGRYGCVMQIQRGDPTVQWLRHRMLQYLKERTKANAALASVPQRKDSGEVSTAMRLARTGAAATSVLPLTVTASCVDSAAKLQDPRAIRQQLLAEYRQPGGATARVSRPGYQWGTRDSVTTRTYADTHIAVPSSFDYVADQEFALSGGEALYVGFSSENLQLSEACSQVQQQEPQSAPVAESAAARPFSSSTSDQSFHGLPVAAYADVVTAPTQDLLAALARSSAPSLPPQVNILTTSAAEAAVTTPRRISMRSKEAGEADFRDVRPILETAHELVSDVDTTLTCAASESLKAAVSSHADSSWSSWSSALSSSSNASLSGGRTSPDHDSNCMGGHEGVHSSFLGSSASQLRERSQGDACLSALNATTLGCDTPTQLPMPSSTGRSPRICEGESNDRALDSQQTNNGEAVRPSSGASQKESSVPRLGRSGTSGAALDELVGAENDRTRESGGRFANTAAAASPATVLPARLLARHGWAEGDCVAFVRVRPVTSCGCHGEVLAMARVASLTTETTSLQWLLRLSETHLAAEEKVLVRRGAWQRAQLTTTAAASTAPSMRDHHSQFAGTVHDFKLGEVVLSNVYDSVLTSVLEEDAQAAAPSAPLQQLLARDVVASAARKLDMGKVDVKMHEPDSEESSLSRQPGRRRPSEGMSAGVQVWRVHCFTDVAAYDSAAGLFDARRGPHAGHPSCSSPPLLRVLCRYAYHVEARLLTSVCPDVFAPDVRKSAADGRSLPSSRHISSLSGRQQKRGERTGGVTTARRSSHGRASSSRVLFTQPQPLLPSGATHANSRAAAAPPTSAPAPSSPSVEVHATPAKAPWPEASEDGCEETLLFPSSSASISSNRCEGRDVSEQRDDVRSAYGVHPAPLGLTPMLDRASPQRPSEAPDTPSSPSLSVQPPQDATNASLTPAVKCLWRVSFARAPPSDFSIGHIRILRSVQTVHHFATHATVSQKQVRTRQAGSHCTTDDNHGTSIDAAVMGDIKEMDAPPQLQFSNETPDAQGGGDEEQSVGGTGTEGSTLGGACSRDALVAAGGRRKEVVVLSATSSRVHNSSAAPMPSLMASSLMSSQSSSSSLDAFCEITASQRGFLNLLQARAHLDEGAARMMLLQQCGHLGYMMDGMRRCCAVSASGHEGLLISRRGGSNRTADLKVCVSAVTWPWAESAEVTPSDGALSPCRYETVASFPAPSASIAGASCDTKAVPTAAPATSTGGGAKRHLPPSVVSRRASTNHTPSLFLSATQKPQHYLQCTLRVLYVELLLHRLPGKAPVPTSEVLAVGLGQATTATDSTIAVRVFCVATPMRCRAACTATHASAASSAWGSPPSAAGCAPPLVGLTGEVQVMTVSDEAALLARVRDEILAYDPDILISWDGFKYGLGHLALRYRAVFQRNLVSDLSRVLKHHTYPPSNANARTYSAAAASALGGDAGVGSGEAESSCPSVTEEGLREIRHRDAEAGELAAARHRSRPPASHAAASFTVRDGSSGRPVPSQESVQCAASMAATASVSSSAAASALLAPPSTDLNDDRDDVDAGGADNAGAERGVRGRRGSALAAQTDEHRGERTMHWAHTGPRWHSPPPVLTRRCAAVDLRPAASTSTLPAPAAADEYAKRFGASVHVVGRICTSLGKDLRKEIKMPSYSLPMVHAKLLGQPLPYFADSYLSELFLTPQCADTPGGGERYTALRYLASRVAAPHRIACKLRWFTRLLEFSRMYGILTKEVITRGSQFRVEATLLRFAHRLGYAMLSPSLSQVHRQPRIECIPLVMQPRSDLYRHDPVVVLDFRSLYPSIIIAYNLCYSTCLGIVQPRSHGRLGVLPRFRQSEAALAELLPDDGVVFSPNGAMFVPPSTRVGLLPQMVQAVLDVRFEVQAALQHIAVPSEDVTMQQRLQEQQLALKMLANVTYGYTAASFTGRMPCVDLAEAIVSLGRQTLERAIALIHSTPAWRAEVVYGDTDSVFVRLAGRTKADAFRIGQEIADAVTQSNPAPIRLQLEKVLLPCLLLVSKRYAGYAWCSPTQEAPTFLAKGIEVVRRDQCPVTAQLADRFLRMLLEGASATALREAYSTAVERLQSGTENPIQCIFRRAVRLGRYKDSGDAHLPLAARLALRQMEKDATQTPYWGERLPYVVVRSTIETNKLTDKVLHPECLLQVRDAHSLDATYYIVRHINRTLDRMFYLVGISFARWYQAMPRRRAAHAALLNLPTFMEAQKRQQQLQGVVPPDARSAGPLSNLFDPVASPLSPRSRQMRLEKLALMMERLHHHHSNSEVLSALSGSAVSAVTKTAVAAEEISDDDDPSGEVVQLAEVADLTRSSTQEVIDVDQFVTQRSNRTSSSLTDAAPSLADCFPKSDQVAFCSGRKKRWRTVTLDSFYPRTLCVICEEETVTLNDISRQKAVLMHVGVLRCGTETVGRCCSTVPTAPPPLPHCLPPICVQCWSDPLSLYLRVQQQCRSMSRLMSALQGLCARCISSGGDAGDAAADEYRRAIGDMEDMDAFCMSSTLLRHRHRPEHACEGVDGSTPRHVLAAVELSAEGVPRGCVSVDCAVGFEKKWVATQQMQWQALQEFLSKVL
ncbi:DNA polymerase zeta catalytic subunit, putative [Leishmania tarentolae]|uniref:DNA-directed DNA polymerase n=1 Tax=Leishmania tarentolae TaxID=5689 RepID=A0A640KIF9_LEITA|nr:DNA polymerase zeta catalytic subunit, putative [Leishmania tarentolae]